MGPAIVYAALAVPTYTAQGTVQVSARDSAINPLLELAGAGGPGQVETEVEIIKRREMVLSVLKEMRLEVVDPHAPDFVTADLAVALGGHSPVSERLARARTAIASLVVADHEVEPISLTIVGTSSETFDLRFGDPNDPSIHASRTGEVVDEGRLSVAFATMPVDEGESLELQVLPDGVLLEEALHRLRVSALGSGRNITNLVEVTYRHPDRDIARGVVQGLMERYIEQSLAWQTLSASSASDFIAEQLALARTQLNDAEDALRTFAEAEHAVQLDVQAQMTIENSAALEAERKQIELQEGAIGHVLSSLKRRAAGKEANLTANFFEDPILGASVASLTENETRLAVLRATMTVDHPQIVALESQVEQQRVEVGRLIRSTQKNLSVRRQDIDRLLGEAMGSLAAYPEKELQLARHMRDVEVTQKLYAFLLEKHQESEILEASTTTDKRIVEGAAIPHRRTSPQRGRIVIMGLMSALMAAIGVVSLAHMLKRRLDTVSDFKSALPFAVYGTVPSVEGLAPKTDPAHARALWDDNHGPAAEAFRALAVSVSLLPVGGRGRVVQITSSQPSEGKSTVITNLAIALSKAGSRVLLVDLDLRRPVQHRRFGLRRAPGYVDLLAQGPKAATPEFIQQPKGLGISVMTAGSRLPDTLGAVMGSGLEALVKVWAAEYDYVLLDSPPAFVADTSLVAGHVDLLLVVGRPGTAERGSVRAAYDLLARVDVSKGLVLNGVSRRHSDYDYSGGYYAYAERYAEPEEPRKAS